MAERVAELHKGRELEKRPETRPEIVAISGCMFGGKTGSFITEADRHIRGGRSVIVFKPNIDNRWDALMKVRSHDGREMAANPIPVDAPEAMIDITLQAQRQYNIPIDVVALDEFQFENKKYVMEVVNWMQTKMHKTFIGAGLPLDFRGNPFGAMPELLAKADRILQVHAICVCCGEDATRTQRILNGKPAPYDSPLIMIGAEESYEARCSMCHDVPGAPEGKIAKLFSLGH